MYDATKDEIMKLRDQGFGMHEAKRMIKIDKLMKGIDKVPSLETRLILREILSLIN